MDQIHSNIQKAQERILQLKHDNTRLNEDNDVHGPLASYDAMNEDEDENNNNNDTKLPRDFNEKQNPYDDYQSMQSTTLETTEMSAIPVSTITIPLSTATKTTTTTSTNHQEADIEKFQTREYNREKHALVGYVPPPVRYRPTIDGNNRNHDDYSEFSTSQRNVRDEIFNRRNKNRRHHSSGGIIGRITNARHQSRTPLVTNSHSRGLPIGSSSSSGFFSHDDDDDSASMMRQSQVRDQKAIMSEDEEEDEVYVVRQSYGYCSILFSIVQVIILALMMWQCGIAPLALNPMIGPYPDALSEWGGKNSVLILGEEHETYRLLTPILLHAGIIHLAGNVLVQLETGAFFEKEWGSFIWLILYLSSAIGSSVCSTIFMPNAVSVGSSGAVMGLFGGKLAEVLIRSCDNITTAQDRIANNVRKEQCGAVTCSVIIIMLFSFIPFVDWAAHVGGLIFGFCVGLLVFSSACTTSSWYQRHFCLNLFWFIIGLTLTVAAFTISLVYMYSGQIELIDELHDVCGYYKEYYDGYECNCMRDEYLNYNNNNNNNDGNGDGENDGHRFFY